ncbi:MAG: hypothetical protein J5829_07965 [Lachnospiraceae bacterium]|nr:hypothetical protein [Lachnospiraceae bacterium]
MFFKKRNEKEEIQDSVDTVPGTREHEIKCLRYGKKPGKKKADLFIRSFMMINVSFRNNLHGINLNDEKKELEKNLRQMGVLDQKRDELLKEEWKDFAKVYLKSCLTSHQYRSALSGMITLSDEKVAHMIIEDIDTVLRRAPERFGYGEDSRELYEIFREQYFDMVEDGNTIWDAHMETIRKSE